MHFFLIDRAVAIRVIEFEAHLKLFAYVATARGRDGYQVLEKVDLAALVRVEHVEDLAGEFFRLALRIELFEHVGELFSVELTFWTVFLQSENNRLKSAIRIKNLRTFFN